MRSSTQRCEQRRPADRGRPSRPRDRSRCPTSALVPCSGTRSSLPSTQRRAVAVKLDERRHARVAARRSPSRRSSASARSTSGRTSADAQHRRPPKHGGRSLRSAYPTASRRLIAVLHRLQARRRDDVEIRPTASADRSPPPRRPPAAAPGRRPGPPPARPPAGSSRARPCSTSAARAQSPNGRARRRSRPTVSVVFRVSAAAAQARLVGGVVQAVALHGRVQLRRQAAARPQIVARFVAQVAEAAQRPEARRSWSGTGPSPAAPSSRANADHAQVQRPAPRQRQRRRASRRRPAARRCSAAASSRRRRG